MTTVDQFIDGSATTKESAEAFIEDPLTFFDMSLTKMQSVPRDRLEELQTEALTMRFEPLRSVMRKNSADPRLATMSTANTMTTIFMGAAVAASLAEAGCAE